MQCKAPPTRSYPVPTLVISVLFGDEEMAAEILKSDSPKAQKAMGRKVEPFDPKVWDDNCKEIVRKGNEAKVCHS